MVDHFSIFVLGSMTYINEAKLFCWSNYFTIANTMESLIRVKGDKENCNHKFNQIYYSRLFANIYVNQTKFWY